MTAERSVNPFNEFEAEIHHAETHAQGRMEVTVRKAARKLDDLGIFPTAKAIKTGGIHVNTKLLRVEKGVYLSVEGKLFFIARTYNDYFLKLWDTREASPKDYLIYSEDALKKMSRIYEESQVTKSSPQ